MSKKDFHEDTVSLNAYNDEDISDIIAVGKALSVYERICILRALYNCSKTIGELSNELNIPPTSTARHLNALEEAALIRVIFRPTQKGHVKYYSLRTKGCNIGIILPKKQEKLLAPPYTLEMPVGMYSDVKICAPCGLLNGKHNHIGKLDEVQSFYLPERATAERIWFGCGEISYSFALPESIRSYSEINFSFECCSETVYFNPDWPSDISVSINGVELLTFTLSGDFGGRKGKCTAFESSNYGTQFGVLKQITVNNDGVLLDHAKAASTVSFPDLRLGENPFVKLTLAVKKEAVHCGGINLFGKNYGDYPQAIVMTVK